MRDGVVQAVEQAGEVVGLLVLIPHADHLLLDNVALHPKAQGQGIGRLMFEEAERAARLQGYASIRLYTNEAMTENIGVYGRISYVETRRAEENGFGRIYMAKELA